ncbi:MAG: hypothetical protein M2R45_00815 [Verrucomicrobia subdivision 3 bacterium]|nr:hypothetical protein [Limisphaerales bacterium]MCS1413079.1 hypothetical protein [Limisphaerales bacterium]
MGIVFSILPVASPALACNSFDRAATDSIDYAGDYETYTVTAPCAGTIWAYTEYTGDETDTYGRLYDDNGNELTWNDDGGTGHNFNISHEVTAGTYYVKVNHYCSIDTGSYTLRYGFTPNDNPNPPPPPPPPTSNPNPCVASSDSYNDSIDEAGDDETYTVTAPCAGTIWAYTTYTDDRIDTYGYLLNSLGNELTYDDDSGDGYNFAIGHAVAAGTYTVKVRGYNNAAIGDYDIYYGFTPNDNPNPPPPLLLPPPPPPIGSLNQPPTISAISDVTIPDNVPARSVRFTLDDPDDPISALTLTLSTDNAVLLPLSGLTLSGTGRMRSLRISPAAGGWGTARVSLIVNDNSASGALSSFTRTFTVNVGGQAPAPPAPPVLDSDGDGTSDMQEVLAGRNPLDASAAGPSGQSSARLASGPSARLASGPLPFVLETVDVTYCGGNLTSTNSTRTIGACSLEGVSVTAGDGQQSVFANKLIYGLCSLKRVRVKIRITTAEYCYWTSPNTDPDFNDRVDWDVGTPRQRFRGTHHVNALHDEFESVSPSCVEDDEFGVYEEVLGILTNPTARPLPVWVFASVTNIQDCGYPTTLEILLEPLDPPPTDSVTINTFIPHNNVDHPENDRNPFRTDRVFKGDNRMAGGRATWNENGSYRTQQKFKVIADRDHNPHGLVADAFDTNGDGRGDSGHLFYVGETKLFDSATSLDAAGNLTAAALADTTLGAPFMIARATSSNMSDREIEANYPGSSPKILEIVCKCEVSNPLVVGPRINYTITITIDRDANTYSITGDHDGFPAYAIYLNGTRVYQYDPLRTGKAPKSLWGKSDTSIDIQNQPIR